MWSTVCGTVSLRVCQSSYITERIVARLHTKKLEKNKEEKGAHYVCEGLLASEGKLTHCQLVEDHLIHVGYVGFPHCPSRMGTENGKRLGHGASHVWSH